MLTGIELAQAYYEAYGKPVLENEFAPYLDKITVGLVGEGSECFGFDDEWSKDHDYGPSFCLWLSETDYQNIGSQLKRIYASFPQEYAGEAFRFRSPQSADRRGIIETKAFYRKFLGNTLYPRQAMEWLRLPESYLAVATNGKIFAGEDTEFLTIRRHLLGFYPEDARKKKLAANLIKMAHSGQVNYERMVKRQDAVAAGLALEQFILGTIRAVYLLNYRYCPYYKWMWRGLAELPDDHGIGSLLKEIAARPAIGKDTLVQIDVICKKLIEVLYAQGLSTESSDYLEDQAIAVTKEIRDAEVKNLPIMMG